MMMMTESVDRKRRSQDGFVLGNASSSLRSHNVTGGKKRLKTCSDVAASTFAIKEKKDKIGERVAKLQQLLSPFGKTDTASVLSEAAAYIRFLHDQLKVLSAPYLGPAVTGMTADGDYYSLRNRGLCLVPVTSLVGIARSNGADLWAPANLSTKPSD